MKCLPRRVTLVEQERLTLLQQSSSPRVFYEARFLQINVFCIVFCGSLFAVIFLFWCIVLSMYFFDLRFLITSMVSSNIYNERKSFQYNSTIQIVRQITRDRSFMQKVDSPYTDKIFMIDWLNKTSIIDWLIKIVMIDWLIKIFMTD